MFLRFAMAAMAAAFLAGCTTTDAGNFEESSIHIVDVAVTVDGDLEVVDSFEGKLKNVLMHYAAAYNSVQEGRVSGYVLKVHVTGIHYKNPVLSILVSDGNVVTATATVVDPTNGEVLRKFDGVYVDGASYILNGLTGAVLSVAVTKGQADDTLTKGLASHLMKKAYLKPEMPGSVAINLKNRDIYSPPLSPISPMAPPPPDEPAVPPVPTGT